MQPLLIAGLAVGLALSGCGSAGRSGESSAPVESVSASGEVVGGSGIVKECPEGHPARGVLSAVTFPGRSSAAHDGVVRTIYNDTDHTIGVDSDGTGEISCFLNPGRNTMFAGSMGVRESRSVHMPHEVKEASEMFWLYLSARMHQGVTAVGFLDPNRGEPQVFASQRVSNLHSACPPDEKPTSTGEMEQASHEALTGDAIGALWIERLRDDKNVARQGTGWDGWAVNDWARIDLRVYELGSC